MCFILNINFNANNPPPRVAAQPPVQHPQHKKEEEVQQKAIFADDVKVAQRKDISESTNKQKQVAQQQATGQTQSMTTSPPAISDAAANIAAQRIIAQLNEAQRRTATITSTLTEESMKFAVKSIEEGRSGFTPNQQNRVAAAAQASPEAHREANKKIGAKELIAGVKKNFGNPLTRGVNQSSVNVATRIIEYAFLHSNRGITSL